MSDVSPALRISDADREAAVARLRTAGAEGRLEIDELEERVAAAYAAKTRAELEPLFTDLPVVAPPRPGPPARRDDSERGQLIRRRTAAFLTPNIICIAIWLATGASGHFWPVWVLLGTGIGYAVFLVNHVLGVEDD
ncbi:MAG: DUF1707 domain-containing protein [Solirubrobacteraceae bacterium]|nr:DUF1707 domain-containing protein [Solirubrobacteraceae bacterium]